MMKRNALIVNLSIFVVLNVVRFMFVGVALPNPAFYLLFNIVFIVLNSLVMVFAAEKVSVFHAKLLENKKRFFIGIVCVLCVWFVNQIVSVVASKFSGTFITCALSSLVLILPWVLIVVVLLKAYRLSLKKSPVVILSVIVSLITLAIYFGLTYSLTLQTNEMMNSNSSDLFVFIQMTNNLRMIGNVSICEMIIGATAVLSISFAENKN